MRRPTSRYLLFDDDGLLGRVDEGKGVRIEVRSPRGSVQPLAFAGVHVVSPEIFRLMDEREVFSVLDTYLSAAERGLRVEPFRVDGYRWVDIGKPAELEAAERLFT
jgi:NDP-sugar pyrophosphorylase family protein